MLSLEGRLFWSNNHRQSLGVTSIHRDLVSSLLDQSPILDPTSALEAGYSKRLEVSLLWHEGGAGAILRQP